MRKTTTDVLVVGAGPAGLVTAIGLAQQNIDFQIIDALPEAQNSSRAAVIHAATLEALETLGLSEPLVAQGIKVPHFRIRDRGKPLLHANFSSLASKTRFALMIPQDETEQLLTARLQSLGHSVRRPALFRHFARSDKGVLATCEENGTVFEIAARYIVGADGEGSRVRETAGIAFPGELYGSFLLADVEMNWPIPRDEVTLFFSEAGTLVVAPMSRDRFRVVAQHADAPKHPAIEDIQSVIEARGPGSGARVSNLLWGSRFQVHHKLADRFCDGPVLLVGDAAHVHSPAGGQGMNLGIRDAILLCGALASALQSGSQTPLVDYARERREQAAKMLNMTDRLTRVATSGGPMTRWIRNRIIALLGTIPFVRRAAARRLAGFG